MKQLNVTLISALLLLSACAGKVDFAQVPVSQVTISALTTQTQGTIPSAGSSATGAAATLESLKTLQPTLAVRGMACLMCHADIQSNIVTDFGYGDSFYMSGSARFDQDQGWYNNMASNWQVTKQILGTVYVPDVPVTLSAQNLVAPNNNPSVAVPLMKIKDLMLTPYTPKWNYDGDMTPKEMAYNVKPPNSKDRVVAEAQIVIRAPDVSEIQALAPQIFAAGSKTNFVRVGASDVVSFIEKTNGSLGTYTMNDESQVLNCQNSDIVVNGTLYLRGLKVNAAGGCRLYVTGSVFIEDAVTYVGSGANPSLQITSSRAISMGISLSRLTHRLINDSRGLQLSGMVYGDLAKQVVADATMVASLKDAQDDYSPRASINFSGLLLNAPIVHSRYLGTVKGTIIAQAALFALGAFHFEFDPVFTVSSVLPLLTKPVLITKGL